MDESSEEIIVLLDACGRRLHALLTKITANRDAADELLQDLFVRLMKTQALNEAPNPEAYLFRSAINLAFDWRKQSSRRSEFTLLDEDLATEDISPLDRLVHSETTKQVLYAMDRLSDSDRELISLRYIQGETNEWIASRFNLSPHHIRSRCSKAMAKLRKLISQAEVIPKLRRTDNE